MDAPGVFPDIELVTYARDELGPIQPDAARRPWLFSVISQNWRPKPLASHEVIVKLIAATTTRTGLLVQSALDTNVSPAAGIVPGRTHAVS